MCVRCLAPDFEGQYFDELNGVLCFNCLDDLGYDSDLIKSLSIRHDVAESVYRTDPAYREGKLSFAYERLRRDLVAKVHA